ncbi:MAG: solute:sodium symporter family transporter [Bacteroidetes bacterium GWF2_42_66]|nr:MAG: solute:sodium symporter family transporter [Bacteroidetes bacterium GWA2_42_15]OFY01898.1 MAG: solute:sodium symporter family transporter [Bacteroidetes bacterium GWE2_42_39]OFY44806.1 MAG: solute:sodium symporter family transporter [Bacteroidetes bacterium GWF2_42_66]HBL75932.1 solute:sodium symporter family transporter [Prolixibacteraceae bacterium]HCU62048.1 solute:sodium symporter family transporter [Prolixibacteraceae bacterium]
MWTFISFTGFTAFVAFYAWFRLRKQNLHSSDGYFLGGRSLSAIVIAGSMIMTNISTEHLIGMNGSAYKNGLIIISWEVTATLGLILGALFLVPRYLRMGLTTIPKYLELRFDQNTRTIVASLLILSFVLTLLPIVLYTGAINFESIFNVSEAFGITRQQGIWIVVVVTGVIGAAYSIFGGLKAVAVSDTVNGVGLLIGGLLIPILALVNIGDGSIISGMDRVFDRAPEKFSVIGAPDSVLPFGTLFTGLAICQIYFWSMHQTIIQRALGAKDLITAQKGLLLTGVFKILVPIIIAVPGVIGFYYFGDSLYDTQDMVYPMLIKKVLPVYLIGFFAAVMMGAVLSTFNSVINSAATIYTIDIYKVHINKSASEEKMVRVGKSTSTILSVFAILVAPLMSNAPEGLYQLMQTLNGFFYIPLGTIFIAGFFLKKISAAGVKVSLAAGLLFYFFTTFIVDIGIHFVHVWGIMFVGMMAIMFVVSYFYPVKTYFNMEDAHVIDLHEWKYAKLVAIIIGVVTISVYVFLWGSS